MYFITSNLQVSNLAGGSGAGRDIPEGRREKWPAVKPQEEMTLWATGRLWVDDGKLSYRDQAKRKSTLFESKGNYTFGMVKNRSLHSFKSFSLNPKYVLWRAQCKDTTKVLVKKSKIWTSTNAWVQLICKSLFSGFPGFFYLLSAIRIRPGTQR